MAKRLAHPPHPIDLHVGQRLRLRRRAQGVSQEDLGARLGLTFQQVQKYERGANRISASRLYEAAIVLATPIAYFFEGVPQASPEGDLAASPVTAFLASTEGLEMALAISRVAAPAVRRRVLSLLRALADTEPSH
ncbi:helix-turn-helix domain-containing protein [Caulobacter hibisci]|uniref:Helix-turn-helix transcriptional regulator n=1 Tax=Caulobacter hibisci TaxID=2035993 RepID=A0ABS0SY79_9CAUL|nr:helix-turn-helix transcriptional regulator [Caulobacter hibisci]MBI1684196.1 helix-turn-helix transcriptional regulator [Caulobacter hibisci]